MNTPMINGCKVAFLLADVEVVAEAMAGRVADQLGAVRQEADMSAQGLKGVVVEGVVATKAQLEETAGTLLIGFKEAAQGVHENVARLPSCQ